MANFESSDADRVFNEALWIVQAEQNQISAHNSITTAAILGGAGVANTVISLAVGGDFEVTSFADFIRESTHMMLGITGLGMIGLAGMHLVNAVNLKVRQNGHIQ
ncbi:MAG: hypothetical protein WC702_04930 [Patescibacteria group bacterium]|jgi:hypothetical protein